jgi:cytochrome c biogenesis protein CcmG/thiol:disulfide interchange protein DsbE
LGGQGIPDREDKMNHRSLIAAAALWLLLSASAFATKVGEVAPDFTRTDFANKPLRLSDHRGKLVLLNFWATWCPPCREEMPLFSRWHRELEVKGLQVIGVSMDDDAAMAKEFLVEYPVAYPVVMGDVKLAETFGGVLGLPLSYLIDAQGRVVARYQGEADLARMEAKIRELLAQPRQ